MSGHASIFVVFLHVCIFLSPYNTFNLKLDREKELELVRYVNILLISLIKVIQNEPKYVCFCWMIVNIVWIANIGHVGYHLIVRYTLKRRRREPHLLIVLQP